MNNGKTIAFRTDTASCPANAICGPLKINNGIYLKFDGPDNALDSYVGLISELDDSIDCERFCSTWNNKTNRLKRKVCVKVSSVVSNPESKLVKVEFW
eukprot:UN05213